jgi:pyruvate kinase
MVGSATVIPAARKARIVCTLGPATSTPQAVAALVEAGMDVARLNFSHGTHQDHLRRLNLVRSAAERAGRAVAVLQDLQGPKIRVGHIRGGKMQLKEGQPITITTRDVTGHGNVVPTTYAGLPADVRKGEAVLLDDGRLRLEVTSVSRHDVKCRVIVGGPLSDNKGINLPESDVSAPALTEKDVEDVLFGREIGVDFIALSFVRSADDVHALRKVLGGASIPLIAKIEKPQAVDRITEIAAAADGVMVARGDLGVELPLERVPLLQKTTVERTTHEGKLCIVATEMLESMVHALRPTRAEVSDVANAILDGADAVMLSEETATGAHPVEAVRTMSAIIAEVEHSPRFRARPPPPALDRNDSFPTAVARACVAAAEQLGIATIVACTQTGRTARLISEHRPGARVIAFTPLQETFRRMALYWGVTPFVIPPYSTTDEMLHSVAQVLIGRKLCRRGEAVVIASGVPNQPESTNLLTVHRL